MPVGQHPVVDGRGEEHGEAGEVHAVGAVAGHGHHQDVHDQPEDERTPQEHGGVVAGAPASVVLPLHFICGKADRITQ